MEMLARPVALAMIGFPVQQTAVTRMFSASAVVTLSWATIYGLAHQHAAISIARHRWIRRLQPCAN